MSEATNNLISFRRDLHAYPEVSGQEYQTAKKIADYLTDFKPSRMIKNVGGTGVIAVFDSGKPGDTVLFRAELDALPIQETNDFDYRSKNPEVSHKCGHDGHATILLGLAKRLSHKPIGSGKVALLFQPAEENGLGAQAVLEDPEFTPVQPDYVIALHNLPGYPMHQIVIRQGSFTAAVQSMTIKLKGKTAHAAEPEHGINPALAIAEVIKETEKLSNNNTERPDFAVVTPIHIEMGSEDYGISAGYGEVRLTIRCWTETHLSNLTENIEKIVQEITKEHLLNSEIELSHHFAANANNSGVVDIISECAHDLQLEIHHNPLPFKWGEDFGLFTQRFKGAMFGLGAGENTPALHNPDYDFPDQLIETGANIMYQIASKILN